ERVLISAHRNFVVGFVGVKLSAREDAFGKQLLRALVLESRLVQQRSSLTNCARVFDLDVFVSAFGRQTNSSASLRERRLRLLEPESVVLRIKLSDELSLLHYGPEIHRN